MHVTAAHSGSSPPSPSQQSQTGVAVKPRQGKREERGRERKGAKTGRQQPHTQSFLSGCLKADWPGKKAKAEVSASHFRAQEVGRCEEERERGSGSATSPPLVLKQPWRGARGVRKQSAAAAVVREGDNHGALKPPLTSSIAASRSPPLFLSFTSIVLFCFSASLIRIPASVLSCTACDCSV